MLNVKPPKDTPEYAHAAWFSALMWAAGDPDIKAAFVKEEKVSLPKNFLDQKIDEASGYGEETVKKFVVWFNKNVWGPWDGKQPT